MVIHYTAGAEGATSAEDGASYDQRRTDGTSAHFHIDRDSIIQCVDTANRSHTALYHGNLWGIHLELAGTVQTRAQWLDAASRPTIRNAARVCAWAMAVHGIPLQRLVGAQVREGHGICGHVDCTTGFPEDGGTHTDPGPQFPWDVLFDDIRAELEGDTVADETNATELQTWGLIDQGVRGMTETSTVADHPAVRDPLPAPGPGGTWSRPNNWLKRTLLDLQWWVRNPPPITVEVILTEEDVQAIAVAVAALITPTLVALPATTATATVDLLASRAAD